MFASLMYKYRPIYSFSFRKENTPAVGKAEHTHPDRNNSRRQGEIRRQGCRARPPNQAHLSAQHSSCKGQPAVRDEPLEQTPCGKKANVAPGPSDRWQRRPYDYEVPPLNGTVGGGGGHPYCSTCRRRCEPKASPKLTVNPAYNPYRKKQYPCLNVG